MYTAHRTPPKKTSGGTRRSPIEAEPAGPAQTSKVRRNIGEGGSSRSSTPSSSPNGYSRIRPNIPTMVSSELLEYETRTDKAMACRWHASRYLASTKRLNKQDKTEIQECIDRLVDTVQDLESELQDSGREGKREEEPIHPPPSPPPALRIEDSELRLRLEEHCALMTENTRKMEEISDRLLRHQKDLNALGGETYASVAAGSVGIKPNVPTTLHSIVVTSKDETETAEEVLTHIRQAVNARDGGVAVERIRKGKDRKVIVGCRTEEERQKVRERLGKAGSKLNVELVKNKDPLVILTSVQHCSVGGDILGALKSQNEHIFADLDDPDIRVEIAYKRRARNPNASHVVMRVSPKIWQRLIGVGSVLIDLQRVRVADQSPLVQCSQCLGYGHGRRFCTETAEKCSHCGGPHMRTACPDWLAGVAPSCCNCTLAKLDKTAHSAFSSDCPVRGKWDAIARTSIAYS